MDAQQWVALELEHASQTAKRGIHTAAIAEAVRRSHHQPVEPLVPGRYEQSLERCPMGEPAFATTESVLTEPARHSDNGSLDRRHMALELGPFAAVETIEGPAADEFECPPPGVGVASVGGELLEAVPVGLAF